MEMTADQQAEHREKAKKEATEDWNKPILHLLTDVHDELLRPDHTDPGRQRDATKRIASLNAVIARKHTESSNEQLRTTAQAAETQAAYSEQSIALLGSIDSLAKALGDKSESDGRKIWWLNLWMLTLTVFGVGFAGCSLRYQYLEREEKLKAQRDLAAHAANDSKESKSADLTSKPLPPAPSPANPAIDAGKTTIAPPSLTPTPEPQNSPKEVKPLEPVK